MKRDKAVFLAKYYKVPISKIYKNRRYQTVFSNMAYDQSLKTNKLNWFGRLKKWFRLTREISKKIQEIDNKQKEMDKGLLGYKTSGVPVLKMQLDYLREVRKAL